MATQNGNGGNAGSISHSPIVPAPIATADTQHVCFICLQTDTDAPNGPWVNACPCSLEAHETCMLQWIAEMESTPRTSANSQSGLRCPACRARILVDEPKDAVVTFYHAFQRTYGRVSPLVLLSIVTGGSMVGSAWYGWNALSVFAGSQSAYEWLGAEAMVGWYGRRPTPLSLVTSAVKIMELSLIGPALVVLWWVPGTEFSLIPGSMLYAASLFARDQPFAWPPSPEWAMTLMPVVHVTYDFVYAEFFGPIEKRFNRILRGRPATEPPAAAEQVAADQGAEAPGVQNGEQRRGGLGWTALLWLGRMLGGPLIQVEDDQENNGDEPAGDHVEVEIRLDLADVGEDGDRDNVDVGAGADDLIDAIQGEFQIVPEDEPPQLEEQEPQDRLPDPNPIAPRQQGRQRRRDRQRERNRAAANNANGNDGQNRLVEEPRVSLFSILMNGMTTTLIFPAISYGMGELVRRVVPESWARSPTRRRPATGLLQYRWGRSLVGACLFFVLRDAFALYYKYRRVQVKLGRKVRNVEKKAARTSGQATSEA
ncbi:hypothetical protein B0T16DRAFT_496201 [Cercophora newfieldiana]|uniref:RING-type domain-containing protein n=1 Tax=Cercophora newfieldiana TaxID=92897 RepID=A0AA39XWE8_9PEZI|nr:hypothetical protein B0T16DRAFT_496201 [Cercophora newfieldiana]